MSEEKPRETIVFLAKLAEQAERYEGKLTVFAAIVDICVVILLESSGWDRIKSVTVKKTLLLTINAWVQIRRNSTFK